MIPCRNKRGAANTVSDLTAVFYRLKKEALVVNLNKLNQMVVVLSNMVAGDLVREGVENQKTAEQAVRVLHGSWVLALLTAWRKGYDEKWANLKLAGA